MIINAKEVDWEKISRDQLKHLIIDEELSDSSIAQAFGVTVSKVRYKKRNIN